MKRSARTRILAASMAAGLLVTAAACSDDDDSADDETTTTTVAEESTSEDTMMDEEMSMDETIVDVAAANPDFSTLVELVTAADLAGTLSEGEYTVFAPTNAAFEAVPADVLEGLGADTTALTAVLTYHVVEGTVLSTDLTDGQEVTTVEGTTFTVNISDAGDVTLTDGAGQEIAVSAVDIEASNGVIHVIDGVLLPGDPAALLGG